MNKFGAMLFSLAALMFLSAGTAFACDCLTLTPEESFEKADTVFLGKVVGAENAGPYTYYKFEVQRTIKGDQSHWVIKSRNTDCDYEFYAGATYLVYAHNYQGSLFAPSCSSTIMVAAAPGPNTRYRPAPDHRQRNVVVAIGLFVLLFMLIGFPATRGRDHAS
jgi:hypothetical protein